MKKGVHPTVSRAVVFHHVAVDKPWIMMSTVAQRIADGEVGVETFDWKYPIEQKPGGTRGSGVR